MGELIVNGLVVLVSTLCFAGALRTLWFVKRSITLPDISFIPVDWQRECKTAHRESIHAMIRLSIVMAVMGFLNLFVLLV